MCDVCRGESRRKKPLYRCANCDCRYHENCYNGMKVLDDMSRWLCNQCAGPDDEALYSDEDGINSRRWSKAVTNKKKRPSALDAYHDSDSDEYALEMYGDDGNMRNNASDLVDVIDDDDNDNWGHYDIDDFDNGPSFYRQIKSFPEDEKGSIFYNAPDRKRKCLLPEMQTVDELTAEDHPCVSVFNSLMGSSGRQSSRRGKSVDEKMGDLESKGCLQGSKANAWPG